MAGSKPPTGSERLTGSEPPTGNGAEAPVVEADILVIGGGIAGHAAAIAIKDAAPEAEVLVVEKNVSGWAGQANKGAGALMYLDTADDLDTFVRFHVERMGVYLEDQRLLADFGRGSLGALQRFAGWGAKICSNPDGSFVGKRFKPNLPWSQTGVDLDMMRPVHRYARNLGVKFADKVTIVDLLKDGPRVAGAIGFSLLDGACHVVKAKATIIATGGQSFRVLNMWSCQRGDGAAMAYRAGAEMRNCEFGPMLQMVMKRSKQGILGAEDALYNRDGQFLSSWRSPLDPDSDAWSGIVWYKEILAGRGPIITRHAENWILQNINKEGEARGGADPAAMAWYRPEHTRYWRHLLQKTGRADGRMAPEAEVFPGIIGELSPIKVDGGMRTTVPGLLAIGNACYTGSAIPGALPAAPGRMRGSGLTGAVWMGIRAGETAVAQVAETGRIDIDAGQVDALSREMYAPLGRTGGEDPVSVLRAIQEAFCPLGYSVYKSAGRMEEALGLLEEARKRIPRVVAKDWHYLSTCNELRSMALSAELFYRASLVRKESRGWFVREDYPERDDANWLQWITMKNKDGEPAVTVERVPIEEYPVRP
jgi:succinate dehydrogenase / fumarate reductase, flavoprotein subunit